eukprot:scaffold8070_cov117-Cylindrotheca_fusiformis.AAC.19
MKLFPLRKIRNRVSLRRHHVAPPTPPVNPPRPLTMEESTIGSIYTRDSDPIFELQSDDDDSWDVDDICDGSSAQRELMPLLTRQQSKTSAKSRNKKKVMVRLGSLLQLQRKSSSKNVEDEWSKDQRDESLEIAIERPNASEGTASTASSVSNNPREPSPAEEQRIVNEMNPSHIFLKSVSDCDSILRDMLYMEHQRKRQEKETSFLNEDQQGTSDTVENGKSGKKMLGAHRKMPVLHKQMKKESASRIQQAKTLSAFAAVQEGICCKGAAATLISLQDRFAATPFIRISTGANTILENEDSVPNLDDMCPIYKMNLLAQYSPTKPRFVGTDMTEDSQEQQQPSQDRTKFVDDGMASSGTNALAAKSSPSCKPVEQVGQKAEADFILAEIIESEEFVVVHGQANLAGEVEAVLLLDDVQEDASQGATLTEIQLVRESCSLSTITHQRSSYSVSSEESDLEIQMQLLENEFDDMQKELDNISDDPRAIRRSNPVWGRICRTVSEEEEMSV